MNIQKQKRETRLIELVETHNIVMSLNRIANAPGYDPRRWRRALYHAIGMAESPTDNTREKIRIALELP